VRLAKCAAITAAVLSAVLLLPSSSHAQQRTADKTFFAVAGLRLLAGVCDVASSTQALRYPGAHDVSPLAGAHPGLARLSLIKGWLVAFQTYASWRAKREHTRIPWATPLVVNIGLDTGLAVHNWQLRPAAAGGVR
jgi:hypothetical protein